MKTISFPSINEITFDDYYRFWSKIDFENKSDEECWKFINFSKSGYGLFKIKDTNYLSHRAAYFLHYKIDPGKWLVLHKCNNPGCCNPKHLKLGTQSNNIQQCHDEGRNPKYGEFNCNAKLTDNKVLEIIKLSKTMSQAQIARQYKIDHKVINCILQGKSWKHVTRRNII